MVDRDLILRKIADLDQYLAQLSEYRGVTVEAYRRDWKTQRIIERTLQIAIEACVDIASHVIADRGLRVPATYAAPSMSSAMPGCSMPSSGTPWSAWPSSAT